VDLSESTIKHARFSISEIHQAVEEERGEVESKFDEDNVALQNNLHVSTGEKSSTGDEHKSGVIEVTTSTGKLYSQYATTYVSILSATIEQHDSMHGTNYCSGAPGVQSAIAAAVHAHAAAAADPHAPAQ
jgi:hypothetical protein